MKEVWTRVRGSAWLVALALARLIDRPRVERFMDAAFRLRFAAKEIK